ncbi:hypothetical protein [Ruegeria halocynthiae]|uniref:hypothetical protein n=1 Tax=Ruegeria halocynthiae TaxID=985054 RepID=UPI00055CE42C|nr:hypothetical protein [Ruegeria halocynthiae]
MSKLIFLTPIVIFAVVLAVFMTVTMCGWEGLLPKNFSIIGTCAATDSPSEVFFSFLMLGGILGATGMSLVLFWRRVSR